MATIIITPELLPDELRDLARRDREAVRRATMRTVHMDSMRWIQWSIRGGDSSKLPQSMAALIAFYAQVAMIGKKPPKPKTAKKPPTVWETVKKKVDEWFGSDKAKSKRKRGPRPKKAKEEADPCMRRSPPLYRIPIDVGDYARSWKGVVEKDGTGFVYSDASPQIKAGVIEEGRKPAGIPIAPLAQWVRRKFGCKDPEKAEAIAINISRAAKHRKRPGLHVLGRAHPKISLAHAVNVERELRAAGIAAASSASKLAAEMAGKGKK